MKVRQKDGRWWRVLDDNEAPMPLWTAGFKTKADALLEIGIRTGAGYRGRVAPPPTPIRSPKRAQEGKGNAKPRAKR